MRRTDAVTVIPVGSQGGFVELYERTVTDVYSYWPAVSVTGQRWRI